MTDPILFSGSDHPASNFYPAQITFMVPDMRFSRPAMSFTVPTNEHGFQMMKRLHVGQDIYDILNASSPGEAKRLGGRHHTFMTIEQNHSWTWQCAVPAMLQLNMAKFWQHPDLGDWLQSTGDAELIEHRPDPWWGDNMDGSGRNQLGKILMFVRAWLPK